MSGSLRIIHARLWSGLPLEGDALLARDGRIVAVGTAESIGLSDPQAVTIDAEGGTVTPGLVDAHLHFVPWARSRRQPDLHGSSSRAEALERVQAALDALPEGDAPLVGRGWDESAWSQMPDRAALDAIAPARPVVLHRHDFHALWVNSAALRAVGIDRGTPDPDGGVFERDASGEPNGVAREHAVQAFAPLEDAAAPAIDAALLDDAARALYAQGITSVHDYQRNHDDWKRMRALAGRGLLRVLQQIGPEQLRSHASLGLIAAAGDERFRTGSLKLFADGTLGSRTAEMLSPYDDHGGHGMAMLTRDELHAWVGEAARAGFSVTIHAIGDAAVRHSLDAIEAHHARLAALPIPPRVEHVQLLDDLDLPRFRRLGVIASMQPQHAITDAAVARRAWGGRCTRAYPWRTLLDSGATLAFGSDAPVEPPLAIAGLQGAVERVGADGLPFEKQQAITLDEALSAYTSGAALAAGGVFGPGTLVQGSPADLVVWDRDLHGAAPGGLGLARPRITALAGKIVYDSRSGPGVPGQPGTHPAVNRAPGAE